MNTISATTTEQITKTVKRGSPALRKAKAKLRRGTRAERKALRSPRVKSPQLIRAELAAALFESAISTATLEQAMALIADATLDTLERYIGRFSSASKMPWLSWGTDARQCKIGSKLALVPGTVCHDCYALKNFYAMRDSRNAVSRRQLAIRKPYWVEAMVAILGRKVSKVDPSRRFFRFMDSGDQQSVAELELLIRVARALPMIRFWIPTREYSTVVSWRAQYSIEPENVMLRLSAYKVNMPGPVAIAREHGLTISEVTTDASKATCRAFENNNACGDCRRCWFKDTFKVIYVKH